MRRIVSICLLIFLCSFAARAQVLFETNVSPGPLPVGQSFQVQYLLDNAISNEFLPPDFKDFRLVSGPFVHEGSAPGIDGPRKIKNVVYTLMATRPGRLRIPGASAFLNGQFIKSRDVWVEFITPRESLKNDQPSPAEMNALYYLAPGEDPYQKIRNNLFLKVMVDRKSCFVGEPVTATFKLYSRLNSKSDIVKSPGFYGFTVQDVAGLGDRPVTTEIVDGKKFDVHLVRKVQLYPLQAGSFVIDPMEVSNEIEFSRSIISKKTEQNVSEGIHLGKENEKPAKEGVEVYRNSISTTPVEIEVKSPPGKNKPDNYTGATGRFTISTSVNKEKLARNEEGWLIFSVNGQGNFTQLISPVIEWPAGLEGFDPRIADSLDHRVAPLRGSRVFHYPFVSAKAGAYAIPSLTFSFFDPDSNRYKTVTTGKISVTVTNEVRSNTEDPVIGKEPASHSEGRLFMLILAFCCLAGIGILWYRKRQKPKKRNTEDVVETVEESPSVAEIMKPALLVQDTGEKIFYSACRDCIWKFFALHLGLSGSRMNREVLDFSLAQKGINREDRLVVDKILQECETGMYADAAMGLDAGDMLAKTTSVLESIEAKLS